MYKINLVRCFLFFGITFCLLHPSQTNGQIQLLNSSQGRVSATIRIVDGQFQQDGLQLQGAAIESMSISLQHDDLQIEYGLTSVKSEEVYRVDFEVRLNGSTITIYPEDVLGDWHRDIPASEAGQKQIIWTNLLDRYYFLEGTMELVLKIETWGKPTLPFGIECDQIPTFSGRQRLPYYIVAGLGAASIGLSAVIGAEANRIYEDEYLTQQFEQAAEPFYEAANNKHQTELLLRYAGIAVLVGDAALFIYRSIRYRKKLDAYNEFCGNNQISIAPMYQSNVSFMRGRQLGLKLSYSF